MNTNYSTHITTYYLPTQDRSQIDLTQTILIHVYE
jgi:hypothetical protein